MHIFCPGRKAILLTRRIKCQGATFHSLRRRGRNSPERCTSGPSILLRGRSFHRATFSRHHHSSHHHSSPVHDSIAPPPMRVCEDSNLIKELALCSVFLQLVVILYIEGPPVSISSQFLWSQTRGALQCRFWSGCLSSCRSYVLPTVFFASAHGTIVAMYPLWDHAETNLRLATSVATISTSKWRCKRQRPDCFSWQALSPSTIVAHFHLSLIS